MRAQEARELSLDDLMERLGSPISSDSHLIQMEMLRRQTVFHQEVTEAQKIASKAAVDTAEYTRRNARYMLWSVIVLTIASVATVILELLTS